VRLPASIDTPLRTIAALAVLPGAIILISAIAILIALLGRSDREVHKAYLSFARMCMFIGWTDLQVQGAHHLERGQSYVVVPNHESNWDPPSIIAALPDVILRFIVKQQIMAIPVFGHALRMTGNVTVERNRSRGDLNRIREGMDQRRQSVSMLFFAEGTRSRDGSMGSFKKGAFATAIAHQLPVLPVAIAGTRHVWPAGFIRIRRAPVVLEIGEPISVEGLELSDRDSLRKQTEEVVRKLRVRAYERIADQGFPTAPDV
jgi:1-acyl-sn-glycerol-3-phosphate acyltransferase